MKDEKTAMDEIMKTICGADAEGNAQEETDAPEEVDAPENAGQEVILQSAERADLAAINQAIRSIEALGIEIVGNVELAERLLSDAQGLRAARCRRFEHLVDWDALAKGESAE